MSAISRPIVPISRLHFPKERLHCDLSLYLVANRPSFQDEQPIFLKNSRSRERGGFMRTITGS